MREQLQLIFHTANIVALVPQGFKLLRHRKETCQFGFPEWIAPVLGHRRAEIGDKRRQHIAIFNTAAPGLVGEIEINTVTVFCGKRGKIDAHQPTKTVVPRHDIEIGFLDAGRLRQ